MITETYKGRKIRIVKGTGPKWGYAKLTLNGSDQGYSMGSPESLLLSTRSWINFIDQDPVPDGNRWAAHWYAPGTFEMCPEGTHPMAVGGPCRHSYCVRKAAEQ
jgi:hypothetical protein